MTDDTRRYAKRRAAGQCGLCGERPPREGRVTCMWCARAHTAATRHGRTKAAEALAAAERKTWPDVPPKHIAGVGWVVWDGRHKR